MLTVRSLKVVLTAATAKTIVDDVSFDVPDNEVVALVGGSGSGKTTVGLSILNLLSPALSRVQGEVCLQGKNILAYNAQQMRRVRGGKIGMVFQEPLQAFNPLLTIGQQLAEVLMFHTSLTVDQRSKRIGELLSLVQIVEPGRVARSFPHQLSGGMRQRAMIAQAIAGEPDLIIADEPTSSLDVTLQARIMELFRHLRRELKMSFLLITHDLGVVRHLADQVVVMAAGKIVEQGKTAQILSSAQQPYTRQLLKAAGE